MSRPKTTVRERRFEDLISVGPAMIRDFTRLGIKSVRELGTQDPLRMYERLGRIRGERQDPCVLDVFRAAVAQARNPRLPIEKCQWWWWSRLRKKESPAGRRAEAKRAQQARARRATASSWKKAATKRG